MNDFEFRFFPNPVRNTIKIVVAEARKPLHLEITDLFGRKVKSVMLSASVCNIDVTELANGCYELCIISNGSKSAQSFVIQR